MAAARAGPARVLVLSAPVGEGHVAAARVLAARMRVLWPDARVHEVESTGRPRRDRRLAWSWAATMRFAPWAYGVGYEMLVRWPGFARVCKAVAAARLGRSLAPLLARERPDLVVSTYPMTSGALAWLRGCGALPARSVAVVTDVAVHPFWVWAGVDETWTLLPASREQALAIEPRADVRVAPAAVDPRFRAAARAEALAHAPVDDGARARAEALADAPVDDGAHARAEALADAPVDEGAHARAEALADAPVDEGAHARADDPVDDRADFPMDARAVDRIDALTDVRAGSQAGVPAHARAEARAVFGLDPRAFIVLVTGGSLAFGRLPAVVDAVLAAGDGVAVVVLCGRAERLRRGLVRRRLPAARLRAVGWTEDVPAYVAAADIVLTTAGGMIATEALAAGRPVLFATPVPGHGRRGAEMTAAAGLGVVCPRPADVTATLRRLRADPAEMAALNARVTALDHGDLDAALVALAARR